MEKPIFSGEPPVFTNFHASHIIKAIIPRFAMKICQSCKTEYADDTLQFCLQDGTPLTWAESADTPTVVMGETETVVSRAGLGRINIPVNDPNSTAWQPSQVTRIATAIPGKKGSNTALAVVLTAVGMLVMFGIIGLAALVFWKNSQLASVSNTASNTNLPGGMVNTNNSTYPTPKSTPLATPTSTRTTPTPFQTSATPTPPPVLKSYPPTTRLKFTRGAYSTSFAGDLNPGGTRSLVLGCRSGQSLSANISSGGGCVTFRGGGSSVRMMTSSGDNYVTITNNCSSVVHFSVSITVI